MDVGLVSGISTYESTKVVNTNNTEKAQEESAAAIKEPVDTYEASSESSKSINTMSKEDRAALVSQLKAEQEERTLSLLNMVKDAIGEQASKFAISADDDSIWKLIANGEFEVDEKTIAEAKEAISEDGYWGVKQTSQRLFDFASALAGDDVDTMKKMQEAIAAGYEAATGAWGKELPSICKDTLEATNKLFDNYYKSKETGSVDITA